ncbi:MAG: chemotaxis protein methyltransferase CheR, partial [Bacteroidota bacterium]|nr:chemotaxis protein methyltransferase CheR [Bacteroidota bacterium]
MNVFEAKPMNWVELHDKEFQLIRDLIYKEIGINLTEEKKSLVAGRLQKTMKELNMNSFLEYYEYIKSDKSGEALSTLA